MTKIQTRTKSAVDQLVRYGDALYVEELAEMVELVGDINEDLNHGLGGEQLRAKVDAIKTLADRLLVVTQRF